MSESQQQPNKEAAQEGVKKKRKQGRPRREKIERQEIDVSDESYLLSANRPKRQKKEPKSMTFSESFSPWSIREKEKLLEALHRHSHSAVESISQVVGSKTPRQVEHFIEKMMNHSVLTAKNRKLEIDPEKGAAPLELWLSLVQQLAIGKQRVDHSKHFSKIFSMIGKNEPMPEDSGFVNLNWRNLYQYIADLLGDKAILQPLSNIESLVMLDMMHNLGDTLHMSDTQTQRSMLDLKYQLYKWQVRNAKDGFTPSRSALNNDFSRVEFEKTPKMSGGSSSSSSTTTAAQQQKTTAASTSTTIIADNSTNSSAPSTSSSSLSLSQSQPGTSQSNRNSHQPSSGSTHQGNSPPSGIQTSSLSPMGEDSNLIVPPLPPPPSGSDNGCSGNVDDNGDDDGARGNINDEDDDGGDDNNDDDDEDNNNDDDDPNPLPKLFTLNPLTIPPHLLRIHPKQSFDQETL